MVKESFSELFDFQTKSKIKAGDGLKLNEGKYPFYTSSNVLTKSINEFLFDNPSLIFGTGGLASIHLCTEKFAVSTDCLVAQPKNKEKVLPKYVYHYLAGNIHILEEGFKGAGLKHISKGYISNIQIPLPPLETQKHIAQILDDAAALRDKTAQLIAAYDALAQSIFLDMFGDPVKNEKGWEKVSLNNLCEKIQIGPFGSQLHQADYTDFGIPLINPTNIKNGKVDYSKIAFITEEKYLSLPNYHLQVGDVLMARRGDLSKIGLVIDEKCFCGTGSLFLRPKKNLNSIYALSVLGHKSTIDKLYEKAQGITMANLNKSIISSLEVTAPPIALQNQFAEKIALIEQQKELAKQELAASEDLFNCLLQKAFKGELA